MFMYIVSNWLGLLIAVIIGSCFGIGIISLLIIGAGTDESIRGGMLLVTATRALHELKKKSRKVTLSDGSVVRDLENAIRIYKGGDL